MKIEFSPQAERQLQAITSVWAERIRQKLLTYASNPSSLGNQIKRLKNIAALRLRVGDYRVIFREDGVVLYVIKVGHRRDIYN